MALCSHPRYRDGHHPLHGTVAVAEQRRAAGRMRTAESVTCVLVAASVTACHSTNPRSAACMTPRDRYVAASTPAAVESARSEFIHDLRDRYGPPGDAADHRDPYKGDTYARRAAALLREWNPLHCTSEEVRLLLGPPHLLRSMSGAFWGRHRQRRLMHSSTSWMTVWWRLSGSSDLPAAS